MTKVSSVLFGGVQQVGKRSIIKRATDIGLSIITKASESEWKLETKYFVAKLKLVIRVDPKDLECLPEADFEVCTLLILICKSHY